MKKIRQGDMIVVLTGRDKGRTGKVIKFTAANRVLVEGVNMVKKHMRPNPNKNEKGGILDREAAIHVSNIALLNPKSNKGDRVGIKTLEDGRKVRCFKSDGETVEV